MVHREKMKRLISPTGTLVEQANEWDVHGNASRGFIITCGGTCRDACGNACTRTFEQYVASGFLRTHENNFVGDKETC